MRPLVFAFAAHGATGELGARASCAFALHGRFILEREAPAGGGMSETPGGRGRVDQE